MKKNVLHLCWKACDRSLTLCRNFLMRGRYYSWKYAAYDLMEWIGFYGRKPHLSIVSVRKKQAWLDRYFVRRYSEIVERYLTKEESHTEVKNFKIWMFWGQGEENMPPLVRACYRQLCKNNGKENVILLDMCNIRKYVTIPKEIYERLNRGALLYAHFSDILRQSLIAKYGGMWVDATCWTGRAMPEEDKKLAFISPHNEKDGTYWCTYAMGSSLIGSVTFSFVRDMLIAICLKEKFWPDYLLQDRLLDFAHRELTAPRHAINGTPNQNTRRFLLYPKMNAPYDEAYYQDLVSTDWLFKLTYKSAFVMTSGGRETFYAKIIEGAV